MVEKGGAVVIEIDATLLTGSDWGESRVSGEHFGQPYVSSRCKTDVVFLISFRRTSMAKGYQTVASRCTMSGNCATMRISNEACALGLARPCSQFSSVRGLVRR